MMSSFLSFHSLVSLTGLVGQIRLMAGSGQMADAVPKAYEALSLLGELRGSLSVGTTSIGRIRALLEDPRTVGDGLGMLEAFVRSLRNGGAGPSQRREFSPFVPSPQGAFWRLVAMSAAVGEETTSRRRVEREVRGWRYAIGNAVAEALRWRHVRYSPTYGVAQTLCLAVRFDPHSGSIHRVTEIKGDQREVPEPSEALVEAVYLLDNGRIYLEGSTPTTVDALLPVRKEGGARPLVVPEVTYDAERPPVSVAPVRYGSSLERTLAPQVRKILEGVNDQPILLTPPRIRSRRVGDVEVIELPTNLPRENADYVERALARVGTGMMTIAFTGSPTERVPEPDLWVSVAENGLFVGLVYEMPREFSPRGTGYEVGTPSLGTLVKIRYALYELPISSRPTLRVPLQATWKKRPSRIQRAAVERWMARGEFEQAKATWLKVAESL